ncbi:MAG: TetR/AcrR family transcriptional regulator [Reinekea sp.]|nr:TetR/AcrR family transcriptional regulator [Reinekea sp.]
MAQLSKKDQIANAALALFLEHGIKGTSVDMVVKSSGVSKPTVYNHFPDKATLMLHVIECWVRAQPAPAFRSSSPKTLTLELGKHWLTHDTLRLYGLLMGEGFRAPEARDIFKTQYDQPWREALYIWGQAKDIEQAVLESMVNNTIVHALL